MNLVTGMHRSGTSFVSHLLYRLGLDFGPKERFLTQDQWNAEGYYENLDCLILNDRILLGDRFYRENRWRLPPGQRKPLDVAIMALLKLRYFVDITQQRAQSRGAEKAEAMRAFAESFPGDTLKDPRFCYTLSSWHAAVGVKKLLFVARNPRNVVASIKKREQLPTPLGYRLWQQHIEAYLAASADLPNTVVWFDKIIGGGEGAIDELKRLYKFADRAFDPIEAEEILASVFRDTLTHFRNPDTQYPQGVQCCIDALNARQTALNV